MYNSTEKPRRIRVLLIVLKNYFKGCEGKFGGLCIVVANMANEGIITDEEYNILNEYIKSNPPFTYPLRRLWYNEYHIQRPYFWQRYRTRPRLRWLKKHIKKNK